MELSLINLKQLEMVIQGMTDKINKITLKMKNYRSNWAQDDPTADDYIENKPFYSEMSDVTILPTTTLDCEAYSQLNQPFDIQLVEGTEYTVVFDEVTYKCVAKQTYENEPFIGNSSILAWNDNVDTGEPFFIDVWESDVTFATTISGQHTISVSVVEEVVHQLDPKFVPIPDNVVSEDDLAPIAFSGNYNDLANTPTIPEHIVKYDVQYLTEDEQAIARKNIKAISNEDVYEMTDENLSYPWINSARQGVSFRYASNTFYRVSNDVPNLENLYDYETTYTGTINLLPNGGKDMQDGWCRLGRAMIIYKAGSYASLFGSFTATYPGVYLAYNSSSSYVKELKITLRSPTGIKVNALDGTKFTIGVDSQGVLATTNTNDDSVTTFATKEYVDEKVADIETIPMVGATETADGTTGTVPAPKSTDSTKFLRGDGTWADAGTSYPIKSGIANILPDTYYTFGEVDSLTVNLVDTGDSSKICEYCFEFIPSDNFTGLTITPEPKWAHEIRFIPGMTCQVSVLRGIGVMLCA
jgi:hypothetical protein